MCSMFLCVKKKRHKCLGVSKLHNKFVFLANFYKYVVHREHKF